MSTKSITGTGLLLAVALLAQSLRLIFPFIPNQVSMFLIGSITSATFVLATWRYGWKPKVLLIFVAALVKAGVLFGGYSLFFSLFQFSPKIVNTMLFVSSWPQLVTSSLGIILALLITKRTKN